jgi:hypothetical protein
LRVLKLALASDASGTVLTKVFDQSFGNQGSGDNPDDVVNYELPSLEVNKRGDAVIAYLRAPTTGNQALRFDEARYSILYHNDFLPKPSILLRKGDGVVKDKKGVAEAPYGSGVIDLAVQSLDPSDGESIWVTHCYGQDSDYFGIIVTRVKPLAENPDDPLPSPPIV